MGIGNAMKAQRKWPLGEAMMAQLCEAMDPLMEEMAEEKERPV